MLVRIFTPFLASSTLFGVFFGMLFCSCTIEHAEEQIVARHANGIKKTSIWVYPDGEILKRNEWYNDGIKELEIPYKNNEPHGDFKRWTGFGDLVMEGEYKKGLRHGKWTSYYGGHFNKKTEAIRYYKDDRPVGDWEGWHFNGEKAFEEHYSDKGDSIGIWKRWHENGNLAEEKNCFSSVASGYLKKYLDNGRRESSSQYKFGKRDGEFSTYYDNNANGIKTQAHYKQGIIDSIQESFNVDGQVVKREFWVNGSRENIWQWFDNAGNKIAEEAFESGNGKAYGVCEGSTSFCAETTFVAGVPTALWYYKAGHSLRYEEIWRDGEIAESKSIYPDSLGGLIASEGFWKDGKRNGIWRNWYRSGILRDSLTYVNGERVGEQFSYDSTGRLTIHKTEAGKNRPVIMHLEN